MTKSKKSIIKELQTIHPVDMAFINNISSKTLKRIYDRLKQENNNDFNKNKGSNNVDL